MLRNREISPKLLLKLSRLTDRSIDSLNGWFPPSRIRRRIRFRSRFRNCFRKNRVRTCRLCRCCWGVCAEIARQAQKAGHRVSRAKELAELQARRNGRYGKYNSILYERMNSNGELTETENVTFYVSYGVLTEFLRMNVILTHFATETDTATDTWRRKQGMIGV